MFEKILATRTDGNLDVRRRVCTRIGTAALIAVALSVLTASAAGAAAVRTNAGFTSGVLTANDDSSAGPVAMGFSMDFFGVVVSSLYVNNNGNVTFDAALGTYTPFDLTSTARQIIAPFFADVDTRGVGSGVVTYGTDTVDGRPAFGVNWIDVGYYNQGVDKLNSFQLVIIDRSDINPGDADFELNYDGIEWEAGNASGGSGGLGGSTARAGYSNGSGDPGTFFELNGSAVAGAFLDSNPTTGLALNSNVGEPGRYLFEVRGGVVEVCGDGNVTGGEECDDGNTIDGDCCSSLCFFETGSCEDGDLCTEGDTCDGAGNCVGGGAPDCSDDTLCTYDYCDSGTGCVHAGVAGTLPCAPFPGRSQLTIKETAPGKEKIIAKFLGGPSLPQALFGNPLDPGGTSYELCIYSLGTGLVGSLAVDRAGDTCAGKPCWKSVGKDPPDGKGYLYKDKELSSDGVLLIKAKSTASGSKVIVKAKNNSAKGLLNMPTGLAAGFLADPFAVVELHSSDAECMATEPLFNVKKNEPDYYKAKF